MLKSSTNNKTKRRQLLSLNRPHITTSKRNGSNSTDTTTSSGTVSQSLSPICISTKTTLPPIPTVIEHDASNHLTLTDTITTTATTTTATATAESLGEYSCPICNKNLSNFQTSFSRQRHIDACLAHSTKESTCGDDETLESLFLSYCSFCGKSIGHLTGIYKERHFDQCLTILETEQHQAEEEQRLSNYAGHSIPFLQELDLCPSCHEMFPGGGLRGKVRHIKRCAKQRSITMEQLLRKLQWMQWGHLPLPNPRLDSLITTTTTTTTIPTTAPTPPIQYSVHTTNRTSTSLLHSIGNSNSFDLVSSTPIVTNNNNNSIDDNNDNSDNGDDGDDFNSKVIMYKVASWRQTKIKKPKPTEDESIAMALSLSLHEDQYLGNHSSKSRRQKRKVDWNVSNIISVEESKRSARLALERMLEKDVLAARSMKKTQFPLVTSHVQPIIPHRRLKYDNLSTSNLTLWSQASCLD